MNDNPKPIMFKGEMVRAILDGRKTQTRRLIKPQPEHLQIHEYKGKLIYDGEHRMWCYKEHTFDLLIDSQSDRHDLAQLCPYGPVGRHLWVRETWANRSDLSHIEYRASHQEPSSLPFGHIYDETTRWKSAMFMPRDVARITLEITDVKVERLQDISEDDARAEGAKPWEFGPDQPMTSGELGAERPFRGGYACLWDSINDKDSRHTWYANPWVWVIHFKRIIP